MITPVSSPGDRERLRALLTAYHEWMHEQVGDRYDPEAELAEDLESLPSAEGAWIAHHDGRAAGCVLLYELTDEMAEYKRLWVSDTARGAGLGRALVRQSVETARTEGYDTLGLTTPPFSHAAHALYESLGFERTGPYPGTRLPERFHDEAIFMRLTLDDA